MKKKNQWETHKTAIPTNVAKAKFQYSCPFLRDKKGQLSNEDRAELAKELGDVQWYIATLAHYLGVPLEQIVQENVEKLKSRQVRGTLSCKGDNR